MGHPVLLLHHPGDPVWDISLIWIVVQDFIRLLANQPIKCLMAILPVHDDDPLDGSNLWIPEQVLLRPVHHLHRMLPVILRCCSVLLVR